MKYFPSNGVKRIIAVNLDRGECVLSGILRAVQEAGIKDGVVLGAIGSIQKAVFHRVIGTEPSPVDEFVTIEKPMELASVQGVIMDGQAHLHAVFSDLEQTYTGHLEPGTLVLYLVEISIAEVDGFHARRIKDELNIAKFAAVSLLS